MTRPRTRIRPDVEALDPRLALSAGAVGSAAAAARFTPDDLRRYADSYLAVRGGPRYDPALDFDRNGQIDRADVVPILRGLEGQTPRRPFVLTLRLAAGEQVRTPHPSNNGGVTRRGNVTVIGQTTPNSVIFTDETTEQAGRPLGTYEFQGKVLVSDAQGRFTNPVKLVDPSTGGSITNTQYLVKTPFGQRVVRAFPIRRLV